MPFDVAYGDGSGGTVAVTKALPLPVQGTLAQLTAAKYIQQTYVAAGVAPHASTQRQLYTVPTGKVTAVLYAWARLRRDADATAGGWARAEFGFSRNGVASIYQTDGTTLAAAAVTVLYAELMENDLAIGNRAYESLRTAPLFFPAGTQLFWNTIDLSTGGTIDYRMSSLLIEFTP